MYSRQPKHAGERSAVSTHERLQQTCAAAAAAAGVVADNVLLRRDLQSLGLRWWCRGRVRVAAADLLLAVVAGCSRGDDDTAATLTHRSHQDCTTMLLKSW